MSIACLQGSNENESECQLAAAPKALSRWRRWKEAPFSPTFALSLVQKGKNPEFPTSEVEGCFLPRYATVDTFSPESHSIYVPCIHLGCLRKTVCLRWGGACCLPPLKGKGPLWSEELSNLPDLVVGNPQWWLSGNKIKWLETQTWVPTVPEAKKASKAGFSRQPWQAAGTRLRGLLVATCFYYLKTCTPARNTSLWTKFSSFLALSSLEANRKGKVHKV